MIKSIMLLSGGLDSTAVAAWYKPDLALFINYGQICGNAEETAARMVSDALGLELLILKIDCSAIGSGQLSVKKVIERVSPTPEWWPYRNQLLATLSAPVALRNGCDRLVFGSVAEDKVHVDGTKGFYENLNSLIYMQEGNLQVEAPAVEMEASYSIRQANVGLDVLGWTHSCHTGNIACGECRGCYKRIQVLKSAGLYT